METINERFCLLRKHFGLNTTDFARKVGIDRSRYTRMETGPNKPALDAIEALAENLPQVSLDWLLTGNGPMLRESKELIPIRIPASGIITGAATVAEAENVLLRQQVALQQEDIAWLREQLGKSPGSLDAAGYSTPAPRHPAGFSQAARQEVAAAFDAYVEQQLERVLV